MTVKTTRKKLRNSFNMPYVRKKAQKAVKKKHGVRIKKSEVDKVWKNYVEHAIIRPLLKYGKVTVQNGFVIEIVGKRIEKGNAFGLYSKGLKVQGGRIVKQKNFNPHRMGLRYKIKVTDSNVKGKLVFEADKKLKKRVSEHLMNSLQPYRIE